MQRIPPMDKKWWCVKPQEALDLLFDIVPITSIASPTANIILNKQTYNIISLNKIRDNWNRGIKFFLGKES